MFLWCYSIMGNCGLLTLTPTSLLQTFTLKLLYHFSLCTLFCWEVRFCTQQIQGIHSSSRSRSFYFQTQICSALSCFYVLVWSGLVWFFLPLDETFPNTQLILYLVSYCCLGLPITEVKPQVDFWWILNWLMLPTVSLPTLNSLCSSPAFRINLLTH